MKWYLKVFKQYADFGGRAHRKEFWYFVLFNFIFSIVAIIIDAVVGWELIINSKTGLPNYGPCYLTYAVAVLLPALAVAVRRLHDLGKNGWWMLVSLIPIVGGIWLLVLFCADGQSGQNRYDANPESAKPYLLGRKREKSIAIAFIVGATVVLTNSVLMWNKYDAFTNASLGFWMIPALTFAGMLFFGMFFLPAGDSLKTANRQNIAFVLLALSSLISAIGCIYFLRNEPGLFLVGNIVVLLGYLALLALAVLKLLKSERKIIIPIAVLTIAFTVSDIIMQLIKAFKFYHTNPFRIIISIAVIMLAVYYLQRKAAGEENISSVS